MGWLGDYAQNRIQKWGDEGVNWPACMAPDGAEMCDHHKRFPDRIADPCSFKCWDCGKAPCQCCEECGLPKHSEAHLQHCPEAIRG